VSSGGDGELREERDRKEEEEEERGKERNQKWWASVWRGICRASKNGGWEGRFGWVCKIEAYLEVLLEMNFCTNPPNFGVEAHMEAPAGDALRICLCVENATMFLTFFLNKLFFSDTICRCA
jgi:hypothetical protein